MRFILLALASLLSFSSWANTQSMAQEYQAIERVLNTFHQAAATSKSDEYFNLLTDDAVFLGTDAKERWSKEEFKAYALPHFNQGNGWLYTSKERHISFISNAQVAFFDELLHNKDYGNCRGTGVLIKTVQGWKISQYNLSIPLPNEIAKGIVKQIRTFEKQARQATAGDKHG